MIISSGNIWELATVARLCLRRIPTFEFRRISSSPSSAATRIKKNYSELPRTRILPNGEAAPPLDAYLGGLDVRKYDPVILTTGNNVVSDDSETKSPEVTPKRKRKTTGNNVVSEDSETNSLEVTPKRKRKTRKPVDGSKLKDPSTKKRSRSSKIPDSDPDEPSVTEGESSVQPKNTLAVEILENLSRFPHCILLTRIGQFYESYFDQAEEVSRLLGIKLTTRIWAGQRVSMCGFPIIQLNKYLKVLVQRQGRFVAMCEEFLKDPLQGPAGGYTRRVVRVVTPGTLIDEPFLTPYENNYLLAAGVIEDPLSARQKIGLAWIDVSTGEFFAKDSTFENLRDDLVRISPREVVVDYAFADDPSPDGLRKRIIQEGFSVSVMRSPMASEGLPNINENLPDPANLHDLISPKSTSLTFSDHESIAIKLLTSFLNDNLMEFMPKLPQPSKEFAEGRMQIDAHTVKALEIREGMREGGSVGSLLNVVKRTVTSSGTRLLARWLCSPSTSITEIHARQSLVAFFCARPHIRTDLIALLSKVDDAPRIAQKFLLNRGTTGDLSTLNQAIITWRSVQKRIELERSMEFNEDGSTTEQWSNLDALMAKMHDLTSLSHRISASITTSDHSVIQEDELEDISVPPLPQNSNISAARWTIKPDFSPELSNLHEILKTFRLRREKKQQRWQDEYMAPSLTLRSSNSQGMFVHVAKSKRDAAKLRESESFIQLSETRSTSTFFHLEWSQLGGQIAATVYAILAAEKQAIDMLRTEVSIRSGEIRSNARIVDELDVTLAFAKLAEDMNFSRPQITDDTSYEIINGRHPTVELGLLRAGRLFTPNSVALVEPSRLHIITGPNMAGKSTFLRQTALIAILAQVGSFVPADNAVIGIVDKLFSRVGAKDDLFRDRSTFMVEMLETAEILKRATPRSLVIMDEVGRGTTVEDGLAIAFATVHHLCSTKCRSLFATHFHELADMLGLSDQYRGQGSFQHVAFFCTNVDESDDGYFSYSYRLKPGVNRDSHGLKVAQLAGMPETVLSVAGGALAWLKQRKRVTDAHRADDLKTLGQFLTSTEEPSTAE